MELGKYLGNYLKQTTNLKDGIKTTTQINPTIRDYCIIEDRNSIIKTTSIASIRETKIFPDRSQLELGNMGYLPAWHISPLEWKTHRTHPRNNKRNP
jgi:hypothetical protein